MTNLVPAAPDGAQNVIIAIDPYTKWAEAGPVPHLNAHEVAVWFHKEVVCRYGVPAVVRTDRGSEYRGRFARYLA